MIKQVKIPTLTQKIERAKQRRNNKSIIGKRYRIKQKMIVFQHYGLRCSCCGETKIEFLSIDHINGYGNQYVKITNGHLYTWLIKNNFPRDYRTLCMNCNWGRRFTVNKECPHSKDRNDWESEL